MSDWFESVGIVGAGTMGQGIAQTAASAGIDVRLYDVVEGAAARAVDRVGTWLRRDEQKGRLELGEAEAALARITAVDSLEEVATAALVIEAAPERMGLKRDLFAQLGALVSPRSFLATNTSSLSVTEIASACASPKRVIGLHFFNPVPRMQLVEIVRGEQTSDEVLARARVFVARLGKEPIVVRDWPGFASSRLGIVLCAEAVRMLEQGVASAADIDRAMELGYGHPMGPLRLSDLVGLDVRLSIMDNLHRELGEAFRPPPLLRQLVRAGKLGRKTGEGFYRYDDAKVI